MLQCAPGMDFGHTVVSPRGKTLHASNECNELTVFVVVRAPSHEAAAKLFKGHPHMLPKLFLPAFAQYLSNFIVVASRLA